ncbi:MAG: hypothetical protein WBC05_03005 [Sedimentisphaerales bacterium]
MRPITCNYVLGEVLPDLERPKMILDLHSESSAEATSTVALLMTGWYSPRVRAISASPEFESAAIGG